MRLYENAHESVYEELKTYYPVWYRDVLEMDALWRIFGKQLDDVRKGIIQFVDNCFVSNADEVTITRLERFLYISYDGSRNLDERRNVVASFFIGNGHIGEKEIKKIVGIFTDGEITVDFADGKIKIIIESETITQFKFSDCRNILLKRIPAHLRLAFTSLVNLPSNQYHGGALTLVPRFSFIDPLPKEINIDNNQYQAPAGFITPRFLFSNQAESLEVSGESNHGATLSINPRIDLTVPKSKTINLKGNSFHANTITIKGGINFGC